MTDQFNAFNRMHRQDCLLHGNTLTYMGHRATFEYSEEAGLYHGRMVGIADLVMFEAVTLVELCDNYIEAVEDYIETRTLIAEGLY